MNKRRIPETRVAIPKPMNELVKSSLTEETQDLIGKPASTLLIQVKRATSQIPAHSYSFSKNSIQSLVF